MEDPLYKPLAWVVFTYGKSTRFGQILGGINGDQGWSYQINNPQDNIYLIKETDISHELSL